MLLTYRPPIELALAWALLKLILSLWDSSLVDSKSRATPEPTQLLENPKRYPLNEDTFFLARIRCRALLLCCSVSLGRFLTLPPERRPPARHLCRLPNQGRGAGGRRSATRFVLLRQCQQAPVSWPRRTVALWRILV